MNITKIPFGSINGQDLLEIKERTFIISHTQSCPNANTTNGTQEHYFLNHHLQLPFQLVSSAEKENLDKKLSIVFKSLWALLRPKNIVSGFN